jgi:hypothetical protein
VRRIGFGWSNRPDDGLPQADRGRVVAGALIEDSAWLRYDRPILNDDLEDDLAGASRLHR